MSDLKKLTVLSILTSSFFSAAPAVYAMDYDAKEQEMRETQQKLAALRSLRPDQVLMPIDFGPLDPDATYVASHVYPPRKMFHFTEGQPLTCLSFYSSNTRVCHYIPKKSSMTFPEILEDMGEQVKVFLSTRFPEVWENVTKGSDGMIDKLYLNGFPGQMGAIELTEFNFDDPELSLGANRVIYFFKEKNQRD